MHLFKYSNVKLPARLVVFVTTDRVSEQQQESSASESSKFSNCSPHYFYQPNQSALIEESKQSRPSSRVRPA